MHQTSEMELLTIVYCIVRKNQQIWY